MLNDDLRRKVKLIEFNTRRMVDEMMAGQYKSQFKGHGVQFSEHRQYVAGDDVRHIDWKVSARSRDLVIKKYEERELVVFLVVDVSGSEAFGSQEKLKSEIAAEVAAMLAYAAVHTGDKVGMLLFAGEVEKIVPPRKGRGHIQRLIRDLLTHAPRSRGTDLAGALDAAGRIMKHSGIIFVISDLMAQGFEISLKRLALRHDVIAMQIQDPREQSVPEVGAIYFVDPETGSEGVVDTASYAFKQWFEQYKVERAAMLGSALKGGKVDLLPLATTDDHGQAVAQFFRARGRRLAR